MEKWSVIVVDNFGTMQGIVMLDERENWVMLLEVHIAWGHIIHNDLNHPKAEDYNKGDHFNFSLETPLF